MPRIFHQVVVGTNFLSHGTMSMWYFPEYKCNRYNLETSESDRFLWLAENLWLSFRHMEDFLSLFLFFVD